MDPKLEKQMAKMVDAVQPHCDEQIIAAMTCSHAGSMSAGMDGYRIVISLYELFNQNHLSEFSVVL